MEYNLWKSVLLDWVSVKKVCAVCVVFACVVFFLPLQAAYL